MGILTLAALSAALSGCIVHGTRDAEFVRKGEAYEVYAFEDASVLAAFKARLVRKKIPGRYRSEFYVLALGFASDATAPSRNAWINDYQLNRFPISVKRKRSSKLCSYSVWFQCDYVSKRLTDEVP